MYSALALMVWAQDEPRTLVSGDVSVSGFGAPIVQFAPVNGDMEVWSGGGGAALFNGQFFLGGFGTAMASNRTFEFLNIDSNNVVADVEAGYGGLWMGWIPYHKSIIHPTVDLMAGWGAYSIDATDDSNFSGDDDLFEDQVFVMIPRIGVEVNVLTWLRLNASAGYKMVYGLSVPDLYSNVIHPDQNGATVMLTLKFGKFY